MSDEKEDFFNAGLNHAEFTALIVAKRILRPKQFTRDAIISYCHVKNLKKPWIPICLSTLSIFHQILLFPDTLSDL